MREITVRINVSGSGSGISVLVTDGQLVLINATHVDDRLLQELIGTIVIHALAGQIG